jgi:hypothetical protein
VSSVAYGHDNDKNRDGRCKRHRTYFNETLWRRSGGMLLDPPPGSNGRETDAVVHFRHAKNAESPRMAAEAIAGRHLPVAGTSGIRSAHDVRLLNDLYGKGFVLVHVVVDDDGVRFERMKARAKARDPADMQRFRELDQREEEQFGLSDATALADYTLANDGTLADLHSAIARPVSKAGLMGPSAGPRPSSQKHKGGTP